MKIRSLFGWAGETGDGIAPRFGTAMLGASLCFLCACGGGAFSTFDDYGEPSEQRDASSEAGSLPDGGSDAPGDAEAGVDASSSDADAMADDASDGEAEGGDADPSDADAEDADPGDAAEEDAGGDGESDAGELDAADSGEDDDACTRVTWYRDEDGDGWGGSITFEGCEPPEEGAWVTKGDDCHDDNADVHPGQTEFFGTPYEVAGGSGVKSFDYDCSRVEQNEKTYAKSNGNCSLLGGLCSGNGYLAPSPQRSGPGVDPYCGSTVYFTCSLGIGCSSSTTTSPAIRCR